MTIPANQEDSSHYVGPGPSHGIEEYFDEHQYLDCDALAQVLQDQECVYRSFATNYGNHNPSASSTANSHGNRGMDGNERRILPKGDSFDAKNVELQLAIDESLAIALQEAECQALRNSSIDAARSETSRIASASDRRRNSTASTSISSQEQNSIANTSQELLFVGEAIGTGSHGLSKKVISYLPTSKYKAGGLFSRNNKREECVICCVEYKRGDRLITLPCQHLYHADCATRWLQIRKITSANLEFEENESPIRVQVYRYGPPSERSQVRL
ncbi:E3 ubiquitin-protein ligase BIG BROTHER-like isoform X2 [Nymphaea colorata]|uniref:E3 ubiquitin-protein ligase BIG BROTHER-like isoform X2 n=1 Tax=Nymphaea colorata TaxID=210225 RepID=UPI00129D9750|nr:E3 ubiquitin-protein ligase BIG BROTHER-like isoform X2 [Nymphaea colorata]